MKKILLLTACFLCVNMAYSQSDKQLTNYMFDQISFNPGATGYKGYCGTAIYRNQWVAHDYAPTTFLLNLQANLQDFNSGVGLSLYQDKIGFGSELDLKLNYAFHIEVVKAGILSPGIGLGFSNVGFKPEWNAPQTGTDVSLDPTLPLGASDLAFDANFGLFWRGTTAPYYLGISVTHLTAPKLKKVNFEKARHYYVTGGMTVDYDMLAIMPPLTFKPSFLIIADGVTTTFDASLLAYYGLNNTQSVYAGLTYRRKDALAVFIGFNQLVTKAAGKKGTLGGDPDSWTAGYSYDITTSSINEYSKGTHELMFTYCMFPPDPVIARHGNPFILE